MDVAAQDSPDISSIAPRSPTPSTGPDICIVCFHFSATTVWEKRKGRHPRAAHVVGVSPDQAPPDWDWSRIQWPPQNWSWSVMRWECSRCHVTWYSYFFYSDRCDGRHIDDKESPLKLVPRAKEPFPDWTHSKSASPEVQPRPKRPRIDTGCQSVRSSHTPPHSSISVSTALPLVTSSPFVPATSRPTAMHLGESSIASEYSRLYELAHSQSPAGPGPSRRERSSSSSRSDIRRASKRMRPPSGSPNRHERQLSNVQEEVRDQLSASQVPADVARRDVFDPRSPSLGSQGGQTGTASRPLSPPRSATESRPISAGVSEYNDSDSHLRHHRRGSNFDLDNFNRIRRFGACDVCRKRKKRCNISHHAHLMR